MGKAFAFYNNSSHYVQWQSKTFKKFTDCSLTVVDYSRDPYISKSLREEADKFEVEYLHLSQIQEQASSCCDRICPSMTKFFNWAVSNVDDDILMVHGDMFPIREYKLHDSFGKSDLIVRPQRRGNLNYMWEGFVGVKKGSLNGTKINWSCGLGGDTGAMTTEWVNLKTFRERVKALNYSGEIVTGRSNVGRSSNAVYDNTFLLPEPVRQNYKDEYTSEILEKSFLHFKRGSGWSGDSFLNEKYEWLQKVLDGAISGKITFEDLEFDGPGTMPHYETWNL